jgi:hypothetical protein
LPESSKPHRSVSGHLAIVYFTTQLEVG